MTLRLILAVFLSAVTLQFAAAQEASVPTFEQAVETAKSNMMTDPPAAFEAANEAGKAANDTVQRATAAWLKGEALNRMNQPAEAIGVLGDALASLGEGQAGTKLQADLFKARADAASATGNYADGLTYYQKAHDTFVELGEDRTRAITLLNIANIYADARNYTKALSYYDQAEEAYSEDPQIVLARLNNVATAYRELGRFDEAASGLQEALAIAEDMGSIMLQVRILSNLAAVEMDAGMVAQAEATLGRAVEMNADEPSGWEPFLYALEARLEFRQGNVSRAARLMTNAFEGVDLETSPVAFAEFHEAAYEIYGAAGRNALALQHLKAFKRLDDEMRDISATANTSLIGAQFDFAAQELRIERLRTEALEKEIALSEARARQRLFLLVSGAAIMLIILVGGTIHYVQMRRSRNEVRQANTDLEASNVALEKALKAKSEFLATTSHEIRTPLNAILGMSELLVTQDRLDEDARERVELVRSSGLSMKAIVDDILDMAKLESGVASVDLAPCELRATIDSVTRTWSAEAQNRGLTLKGQFDDCPVRATTDERKLRQILLNLISNAVKFTDEGGISVRARLDEAESGSWLEVTVEDTGCGIPEDQLDAIFEPFHQVDSSTTRQHAGTGLGLAISQKLVDALGGTLSVESRMGQGSLFTLRLPVSDVITEASDAGNASADAASVLCIVANPLHQVMLESFIGAEGVDCKMCEGLDFGIMLAASGSYGAVFVSEDVLGSGEEAGSSLQTLKAMAQDSRLVVWTSEDGALASTVEASGADAVVAGEFDLAAIAAALGTAAQVQPEPAAARQPTAQAAAG